MKTEQAAGRVVDYRKDTPPTDWLMELVKERYGHLPMSDIKVSSDYLREFIAELSRLRCEPVCSNGQLAPSCICSLVEQLASPDVELVVPKKTFLAIVCAAGYSQEDALEQYRNYYEAKLWDQNGPEIERLSRESENAHNWWLELESWDAFSQSSAAGDELRALERKIDREVEAAMSA